MWATHHVAQCFSVMNCWPRMEFSASDEDATSKEATSLPGKLSTRRTMAHIWPSMRERGDEPVPNFSNILNNPSGAHTGEQFR